MLAASRATETKMLYCASRIPFKTSRENNKQAEIGAAAMMGRCHSLRLRAAL